MNTTILRKLGSEVGEALLPLERALQSPAGVSQLLRHLGFIIDLRSMVPGEFTSLIGSVATLRASLVALASGEEPDIDTMLSNIEDLWANVQNLEGLLSDPTKLPDIDPGEVLDTIVEELIAALGRLPHYLVVHRLRQTQPLLVTVLRAAGIIDRTDDAAVEIFRLDRLELLLDDTPGALATLYGWGDGQEWDSARMLLALSDSVMLLGGSAQWSSIPSSWVDAALVDGTTDVSHIRTLKLPVFEKRSATGWVEQAGGVQLSAFPNQDALANPDDVFDSLMLSPWSTFKTDTMELGGVQFTTPISLEEPAVGIAITPSGPAAVGALPDNLTFGLKATEPWVIGDPDSPAMEIRGLYANLTFDKDASSISFDAGTASGGVTIYLSTENADGFVSKLVGKGLQVTGDLGLSYDAHNGWEFDLGAGLTIERPGHTKLGPLTLRGLVAEMAVTESDLRLSARTGVQAAIGPIMFQMDNLGANVRVDWTGEGTFGPFDVQVGFDAPNKIGMEIDANAVRGGGYLAWAPKRYEGALALKIALGKSELELGAVGILSTGDPWSLMALITATFPRVDIGFGFALTGVGGLLGLHRDMDVDALRAAVPTGGLKSLLFPKDIVSRAPVILADLDRYFPEQQGRFTGGVFMQLLWGVDDLWTSELGLILSLPRPVKVALVGSSVVRKLTPAGKLKSEEDISREDELFAVRLDVLGVYDGSVPEVSIDAALIDSHIAGLPLEGGAHFRWRGGSDPDFVLTIGGFHPAFEPPPGTTIPQRIRYGLASDKFKLFFESYLALTANTFQYGSSVVLYAEALGLVVAGGFGVDVLVRFRPFGFQTDVWAYLDLSTKGGRTIAAINAEGQLAGPGPWTFRAAVSVRVLGLEVRGEVEGEFGKRPGQEGNADAVHVLNVVQERMDDDAVWKVERASKLIMLREDTDEVLLLPNDVLIVAQEIAPFASDLQHLHGHPVLDASGAPAGSVRLTHAVSSTNIDAIPVLRAFSPASWRQMSDGERLSSKSFESVSAGSSFTVDVVNEGATHTFTLVSSDRDLVGSDALPPATRPTHVPVRRRAA